MSRRAQGFTLIELMVAVAIISILAAVAIPSYNSYILKSRRADAFDKLNEIMQAQERFHSSEMTYADDLTDLDYASATNLESEDGFYSITATACGSGITKCVLLTAVGQNGQEEDGDIGLDSIGNRTGTGRVKW